MKEKFVKTNGNDSLWHRLEKASASMRGKIMQIQVVKKIESGRFFKWFLERRYKVILFFYGLIPFLWFKDKYINRPGEELGYLSYGYLYEKYFYAWSSHLNNGSQSMNIDHIILYPVGVFYKIALSLGVPNYLIQRLFLVAVFYLMIFSFYKLIHYFTKSDSVSFLSTIFYTSSLYIISTIFYTGKMFQMFLMPIFFYLLLRYLETRKKYYLALNLLFVIFFQGIFCNIATAASTFFVYVLAIVYYYFINGKPKKIFKDIKDIFYFILTIVPTLLYVFIQYYFFAIYNRRYEDYFFTINFLGAKFVNIFQLFRGAWWEAHPVYNTWSFFYDHPIIIIISYILFCFLFVGLFGLKEKKQSKKHYLFWLLVTLPFAFLVHGNEQPLPFVYAWMYKNIPLFAIFRNPWEKFLPVLVFSSSILFGYSLKLVIKYKKIFYWPIFLLVMIHSSIFFTNRILNHNNPGLGDTDVLIPPFWFEMQKWSKDHMNNTVLPVPVYYNYPYYHEWYPGESGNFHDHFTTTFLYTNNLTTDASNGQTVKRDLLKNFNPRVLPLWNVEYVLDQKDISAPKEIPRTVTAEILQKDGVINTKPDKSFGPLDLYHINDKYFLPRIYTNSSAAYVNGDFDVLPSLLNTNYLGEKPVVLFSKQNLETKFIDLNGIVKLEQNGEEWRSSLFKTSTNISEPEINFEQINPTKYIVKINKASAPFWLVFSQTFHPYWKAYIRQNSKIKNQGSKFIEKSALLSAFVDKGARLEVKEHYLVNGYANGWYIDHNKDQSFEIVIEYWPQRLFETMWFIFGIALIICFGYLGFYLIKIKRNFSNSKNEIN